LADRITGSPEFLDALAAEVQEHILGSGPVRQQVALAAAQVIQARMAIHADAVGRLARLSTELDEEWRLTQGGRDGGPTPTKDLIGMAMQAHAEITKAEEMVLKAARLALEERKVADSGPAPAGYTFTGEAEAINIPADLSPADREGLRALMGNLQRYVDASRRARETITAQVTASGPALPPGAEGDDDPPLADPVIQSPADPARAPAGDPLAMTATPIWGSRRRRPPREPSQGGPAAAADDPSSTLREGAVNDLD